MTLKIALIGAPNSGKTELAQQLSEALNDRNVSTVDNYIAEVEQRSDVVLGHYATYLGNVQAAIGRFEAERKARASIDNDGIVITCGTLVENAVYTATLAYIDAQSTEGNAALNMINNSRANLTMRWLGVLRHDTWEYDLVYYLPLGDDADKYDKLVDEHIAESAEVLGVEYIELPTAHDARFSIVLQEILQFEATTPNQQSSIDRSGESKEIGSGPGHLSDVPEQA